ncbi:MAG: hypothetical protein ABJD11_04150, partial [Gemmatimonadota bacterium]
MGRYVDKPVLTSGLQGTRVTLETPAPVPRSAVAGLLKGLVEAQGLEFSEDSAFYHISVKAPEPPRPPPRTAADSSGPIQLFVIRLKHARAADVAATVNQLFGGGGEFSGHSGLSSGTLSDELRRNVAPPQGSGTVAAGPGQGALLRLQGERCLLRRWTRSDVPSLVRHANNLNVAR